MAALVSVASLPPDEPPHQPLPERLPWPLAVLIVLAVSLGAWCAVGAVFRVTSTYGLGAGVFLVAAILAGSVAVFWRRR